jgi:transposase IS116/IS110/IS902 family protein
VPKVGLPSPVLVGPRQRCPHAGDDRRRPHKASHTAAALDEHGQLLDQQRIPATLEGYQQLRQWAGRWPQRCWAVEGAHGLWTCRPRWPLGWVLSVGHGRKSDPHDAVSVAVAAQSVPQLRRDVHRFPTKHHFAAHTGTAPLEASSGQVVRHRLSRAGDRKLNHALYMMAMVQIRHPTAGRIYYERKRAEGKSPKEALRCLKRRLSAAGRRGDRDAAAISPANSLRKERIIPSSHEGVLPLLTGRAARPRSA